MTLAEILKLLQSIHGVLHRCRDVGAFGGARLPRFPCALRSQTRFINSDVSIVGKPDESVCIDRGVVIKAVDVSHLVRLLFGVCLLLLGGFLLTLGLALLQAAPNYASKAGV